MNTANFVKLKIKDKDCANSGLNRFCKGFHHPVAWGFVVKPQSAVNGTYSWWRT
jgi:hypothetical protein